MNTFKDLAEQYTRLAEQAEEEAQEKIAKASAFRTAASIAWSRAKANGEED
jgi:hypothetical protein